MKFLHLSLASWLFLAALFGTASAIDLNNKDATVGLAEEALTTGSITPATAPLSIKHVIVIDPGHGGNDPGATAQSGTKEKDVVLAFAYALRQTLLASGRYEVLLTRESDKYVRLDDRVKYARVHGAELFIAVHADVLDDKGVRGTTVYTVSDKASDVEAEALAQKENSVDNIGGMNLSKQKQNVASALMSLAAKESKSEALGFAQKTVQAIEPVTELPSNPLRSAAFFVLKAPDIPSVLIELGYLSNTSDESLLASAKWRTEMAVAMAKAVDSHFGNTTTASAAP